MTRSGLSNRVIKFRADNGMGRVYSSAVDYLEEFDQWRIYDFDEEEWMYCSEPQQFTGLLDKNGVEIYEGDIVEYTRIIYADCSRTEIEDIQEPIKGEVYYAEGLWLGVKFADGTGKLFLPGQVSSREDNPEIEVIGNIYEHPHLLEGS